MIGGLVAPGTYISVLTDGRKTVTVAGTPVQLVSSETPCAAVIVQALRTNAGHIAVGGANVKLTAGSEAGISITAGQPLTLDVNDARRVWIDADNSGEGVSYTILG